MICDKVENDETNPPAYNIWTSRTLQPPLFLKNILNPNGSDIISTDYSYKLNSASSSQKRKLLENEKEDIVERFHKIQRKKHLQKIAARKNLVVDDNESDDSDNEDELYQQMDWIEKQNALTKNYDANSDSLLIDHESETSVFFISRSKLKEERLKLLRISMSKIHNVEDPEAYLRRSVLINNTVRKLQNDPINYQCYSLTSTSYHQGNVSNLDISTSWSENDVCKQETNTDMCTFDCKCGTLLESHVNALKYPTDNDDMTSHDFHLACTSLSSDKITLQTLQQKVLHNGPHFYDRSSLEDQNLNDASLSLVLKQPSSFRSFSSQPCGIQYRNLIHSEENKDEYTESGSSILNSVVYHSLITSLET